MFHNLQPTLLIILMETAYSY